MSYWVTHLFFVSGLSFNILMRLLNKLYLSWPKFNMTRNWHDINTTRWPILPSLLSMTNLDKIYVTKLNQSQIYTTNVNQSFISDVSEEVVIIKPKITRCNHIIPIWWMTLCLKTRVKPKKSGWKQKDLVLIDDKLYKKSISGYSYSA